MDDGDKSASIDDNAATCRSSCSLDPVPDAGAGHERNERWRASIPRRVVVAVSQIWAPNVSIEGEGQRKGAAAQRCALIVSACCGVWAASINVGKNGSSVREMADVTALI